MGQVTLRLGSMLAAALLLAGCSGEDDPATSSAPVGSDGASGSPAGTASGSPLTPAPPEIRAHGVPEATASEASDIVGRALTSVNDALASPGEAATILDDAVVAGAAREALLAQAAEYEDNGWTVTGQPRVVRTVVRGQGARVRVRACVDQSAVVVTDGAGTRLPTGTGAPRTWMVFTLVRAGDEWQVVRQTFPADPDC
ncbi:hypothetical protein [Nocardioides sp. BYT-33-1]|uniref:hypothetical protein n=1 Tax=Nocardioides sp. BYT-33-1 TaxID=3416952 RepID=UPI003F53D428